MINPNHTCEPSLGSKSICIYYVFSLLKTQVALQMKSQKVILERTAQA